MELKLRGGEIGVSEFEVNKYGGKGVITHYSFPYFFYLNCQFRLF